MLRARISSGSILRWLEYALESEDPAPDSQLRFRNRQIPMGDSFSATSRPELTRSGQLIPDTPTSSEPTLSSQSELQQSLVLQCHLSALPDCYVWFRQSRTHCHTSPQCSADSAFPAGLSRPPAAHSCG